MDFKNSPSSSRGWLCTGGPAGCSGQTGPPTGRRGSSLRPCPHSSDGLRGEKHQRPDPIVPGIHSSDWLISSRATGVASALPFIPSHCAGLPFLSRPWFLDFLLFTSPALHLLFSEPHVPSSASPVDKVTSPVTLLNPPAGSIRIRIFAFVASPCFCLLLATFSFTMQSNLRSQFGWSSIAQGFASA